jgi:hypothetical protein
MLDTVVSITLHYVVGADVNFLIATLQPIFLTIIIAYTVEDTQTIKYQK